jgi:hypothetical protein
MVKLSRIILAFFGLTFFTTGFAATLIAAGFCAAFGVALTAFFGAAFAAGLAAGLAVVFAVGLAVAVIFFGALALLTVAAVPLFFWGTGFVLVAMVCLLLLN